jgi:hypothetical protein
MMAILTFWAVTLQLLACRLGTAHAANPKSVFAHFMACLFIFALTDKPSGHIPILIYLIIRLGTELRLLCNIRLDQ